MSHFFAGWFIFLAGLSVVIAGCGDLTAQSETRVDQREWTSPVKTKGLQLITEHYDIRTTTEDTVLCEYLPTFLETAYAEYHKLMSPARPSSEPLVVYLYGRRPEWAAFTKGFVPGQALTYLHIHSGGYMDGATATSVIWDIGRDRTLSLLAHEGFHQYLARHFPEPVPAWLNEGLATQFEDFDLAGARPIFRPEKNLMRKNSLREAITVENGFVPVAHLLAMDAGEAVTKTGQSARGYYAQIWATILFLRTYPQYRAPFARLLADAGTERLRQNASAYRAATPSAAGMSRGEIIFRHYITEDLDGFMDQFKTYARQLAY